MSTKNLIVSVDVQNDFISGPLGSSWAVGVAEKIDKFLKDTADADRKVIGTFDTHSQATYLDTREGRLLPVCHCVSGSEGWMSPVMDQYDVHVCKCEFMAAPSMMQEAIAEAVGADYRNATINVFVFGFCTSICVIANALLLRTLMPESNIYLVQDLCADISKENHEAAQKVAIANQINICTAEEAFSIIQK